MNERLKNIRIYLNLSQEEFGANIGIKSRAHISSLENGSRNITDRIINDVCREYSVSEKWLRTGEGEMFDTVSTSAVAGLVAEYNLDFYDQRLIEEYLKLDLKSRSVLKKYIRNVFLASEGNVSNGLYEEVAKDYEEKVEKPYLSVTTDRNNR